VASWSRFCCSAGARQARTEGRSDAKLLLGLPGLADGLFGYLNKRADAAVATNSTNVAGDVAVNQAALSAFVEERKFAASVGEADSKSGWTCWMLPAAFGFCLLHFGAIVLDSTFLFGWRVAQLPAPYDGIEGSIIATAIGFSGAKAVIGRVFGK
jgi:hypothetical protein